MFSGAVSDCGGQVFRNCFRVSQVAVTDETVSLKKLTC